MALDGPHDAKNDTKAAQDERHDAKNATKTA